MMKKSLTEKATHNNLAIAARQRSTSNSLTSAQKGILEEALMKKEKNDAASKNHGRTAKGKYLRRATNRLAARQKAYASMKSEEQRAMRAPGSMKLRS